MTPDATVATVTLSIPADAAYIRLARLVATGFVSQMGATVADLDDVRTVVDELCSMLLAHSGPGDHIAVELGGDGGLLRATATAPARRPWEPDALSEGIVRVLADDYRVDHVDGRIELVVDKAVEVAEG
jgi:serine/threonine-protein kinase RsbW